MCRLLSVVFRCVGVAVLMSASWWPLAAASQHDARARFAVELPDLGLGPITDPTIFVADRPIDEIIFHVLNPYANDIISTAVSIKINGESARPISRDGRGPDGMFIKCDLTTYPRYRLRPGKNVLEIVGRDRSGKEYNASFIVFVGPGNGAVRTSDIDRDPPRVILSDPKTPPRPGGRVLVAGVVVDESEIVALSVNGQPVPLSPAVTKKRDVAKARGQGVPGVRTKREVPFSITILLPLDAKQIRVEARDSHGHSGSVIKPVRDDSPAPTFSGRRFVVLIGVSDYKYNENGLNDLSYADDDARALGEMLVSRGVLKSDIVLLLDEQATLAEVTGRVERFLTQATARDTVLLFLAGHGMRDPFGEKNPYFLLYDSKIADLPRTALPMRRLAEELGRLRAERIVVFVDTCHSAGMGSVPDNRAGREAAQLFRERGIAVLASSATSELSAESGRWGGHGVFTYALLEGLRGEADANREGVVTAGELMDFVRAKVTAETAGRQRPEALPGMNAGLPLVLVQTKGRNK